MLLWLIIMLPLCALFTGLGIFAWTRKKPMWFWAGSTVREEEITDVRAYNRAIGILWLAFSLIFWAAALAGLRSARTGGIVLIAGCAIGIPLLVGGYLRIEKKYRAK